MHRRKPQPLLCLARRGRGNIGGFFGNTGKVLSEQIQQGANQKAHMQMSKWRALTNYHCPNTGRTLCRRYYMNSTYFCHDNDIKRSTWGPRK